MRRNMKQDILQTAAGNECQISEGINLDVLSTNAWLYSGYTLIFPYQPSLSTGHALLGRCGRSSALRTRR